MSTRFLIKTDVAFNALKRIWLAQDRVLSTCSNVSANQAQTPTRGFNGKMISKPRSVSLTIDRADLVLFSFSPAKIEVIRFEASIRMAD